MIRNILICTTQVPFTSGGAESHVSGLRTAFIESGYNAEIAAVPFQWYPPTEIMRGALAWRLLDVTSANGKKIDLMVGMKFPAYVAAHERKVLWIMHQHRSAYNLWGTPFDDLSTYPEGSRIRDWIHYCDAKFIPEARKVFANSQTVAERLRRFNQIDSEPLYHPPPHTAQLRSGEQGDYIFYPSRLEPQKRQELLIEALRYTKTPVRVVLAGVCAEPKRYESLIAKYGIAHRVCLCGFVDDSKLIDLYAGALAVCYLPFDEDYGYVTLEGMLSGKPVIVARDGGGATEFVENESDGLIVDTDPKCIAEAMDMLFSNRGRSLQMGKRGREKLTSKNITWQNVVEKIISAAG